jgi:hypothetical protein
MSDSIRPCAETTRLEESAGCEFPLRLQTSAERHIIGF